MVGQKTIVNDETYKIIKLLAKGKGGYNYLAKTGETAVVIKQIHYEPCDYFQFEENNGATDVPPRDNRHPSKGSIKPCLHRV